MRKPGGLFGNTGSEIPVNDLKQLETFFYKLGFFLHILDYTGLLKTPSVLLMLFYGHGYFMASKSLYILISCPEEKYRWHRKVND